MAMAQTKDERSRRTLVLEKLTNVTSPGHGDLVKYVTIMQAWNVAVGRTTGADEDSAYPFKGVFPIPVLCEKVSSCTTRVREPEDDLLALSHKYDWTPASIGWDVLARIRTTCQTEIIRYQDSLQAVEPTSSGAGADPIGANKKALFDAASTIIAEERQKFQQLPPGIMSDLALASYGGIVVSMLFFGPAAPLTRGRVTADASAQLRSPQACADRA